jgi:ribonuclease HI
LAVDGSALPNPGRMGIGVVLRQPGGRVHGQWGREVGHGCNNEAELHALTFGLRLACDFGARTVLVQTDSTVLLELLAPAAGHPPKQIARLQSVADEARQALARLPEVQWQWVPRHRNSEADALARGALGIPARGGASLGKIKGRSRKKR